MCKLKDGFKFCTCLDEKGIEAEPGAFIWRLKRINPKLPMHQVLGMIFLPAEDEDAQAIQKRVLGALNDHNDCFDFDYQPTDKDFLIIDLDDSGYRFLQYIYDAAQNQWLPSDSCHLESWRQQLEPLQEGKIV